jgi:hypothetical protein
MPEKPDNEALLKQIRDDFNYCKSYWQENYQQSELDMQMVACIPPKEFEDDRKNRPCIWPDEVSQYVKQANNNLRQNKRSIKVSPRSEDATDQDAEHRQAYIRGIEYASKAQSIYSTAFEAAIECAFGYWRINCRVTGPNGEQEPRIVRIPNQFTVYPDPDARESDLSDSNIYFVTDSMRESTFARKYPNAERKSFRAGDIEHGTDWSDGRNIVVAEAWQRKELQKQDGETRYEVTQHITNGFEIHETNKWIGSWIPIIGVFGEEIYIRNSGQSKRMFLSLIRRARAPQTMLAYIASQEAQEFGMAPQAPFMVIKGSVDPEEWKDAHRIPRAYLEYDKPPDWNAQSDGPVPPPSRPQFMPNAQAYEIARESWRRAIQAAFGLTPLPTSAQRQNEKSGVALEKIQNQEAIGSFHFTDKFVAALHNTGQQLNELITKLAELDSLPKQLLGKDQKDEDLPLRVARRTPLPQQPLSQDQQGGLDPASEQLDEAKQFFAHRGQFQITISDGPNYQSQREEGSAFADTLLQSLPSLGLAPQVMQAIVAIAIKLKNIGILGQEIADLLSPPDPNNIPPQAKAILAQAQGQVQQLQAEVQQLRLEKLGKVTEIQGKKELAQSEFVTRMAEADKDRETKIAVAEIMTKFQSITERVQAVEDLMKQFHEQAHELAMTQQTQKHEKEMAASAAAQAAVSQASDQAHQSQMAESQPEAQS